ncbi:hypothetical protein N7478_006664 [Penicillium angulare]|uniref:uncharacterized protein n=1 Tax=Penicillium angulare TaxID=116970 RepID=UPI0025423B65|nr:uncharacterized protein N7478_006664 [Penicillium angulare]KAJ5281292.1 hypothetical protein N7478_006664 [Penicillium angulare]
MPLVIPGINSSMGDKSEWVNKLMGKKLSDSASNETAFAKKDLPESHRILEHDSMATADHQDNRLNIHLDRDGIVHNVTYG